MPLYLNKYTIGTLIFIMSLAASSWLSYDYGTNKVNLAWEKERVEMRESTILAMTAINENNKLLNTKLSDLQDELETKSDKVKVETVEVEKEVIRYVKNYVTGACPIDGDRLRIKNTAIATTNEFAK